MQPTHMPIRRERMRLDWVSPLLGLLITPFGLFYVATASANVAANGVAVTALGAGWLLGPLLSVGIAKGQ